MAAVQLVPNLGVQKLSIMLQDPSLNWVRGAPPMNTLKLIYMFYAALGLLQPVWGLYRVSHNRLVYQQDVSVR